jgi:hypothetical protein
MAASKKAKIAKRPLCNISFSSYSVLSRCASTFARSSIRSADGLSAHRQSQLFQTERSTTQVNAVSARFSSSRRWSTPYHRNKFIFLDALIHSSANCARTCEPTDAGQHSIALSTLRLRNRCGNPTFQAATDIGIGLPAIRFMTRDVV